MDAKNEEFCDNCGTPLDLLEDSSMTNTCDNCGHPVEPSEEMEDYDDPYAF